jgi:3-phenylpropionate/trans-cinnamate dioxygenase ferredoxin reductase component
MRVVVVGAGQAGLATAVALRARGFTGRVQLIGEERLAPYQRPPLSKAYLEGAVGADAVTLRAHAFYERKRIELELGCRVAEIDRVDRRVGLADGRWLPYDRLVLALGATVRRPAVPGVDLAGVHTLRTVADADGLRAALDRPGRAVVAIGGGFVGMEVAATARKRGHAVTVVEMAERVLGRAVSPDTARHLTAVHERHEVRVATGARVKALCGDAEGRVHAVELADGTELPADIVVVGVGVAPTTGLAERAALTVRDGVVVDAALRTSDPRIMAVGDCANLPAPDGGRIRLESVQNALDQAEFAAARICDGAGAGSYRAVPAFWSAQFGENLQIAGLPTGGDAAVTVGERASGRFSTLLFAGTALRAVESLNRPADHLAARALLDAGAAPSPMQAAAPGYSLMEHARAAGVLGGPARSAA